MRAPDFKNHIEKTGAINRDIRTVLEKDIPIAVEQAKEIAPAFMGDTHLKTAENIWLFERNYIKYKKDPVKGDLLEDGTIAKDDYQDIRLPRRFFATATGDCKSFTVNALAIYKAIYPDCEIAPKYTSYDRGAAEPTHVYAVVKDDKGKQIIIDGCYNFFNKEKDYTFSLPIKFMTVRTLSGTDTQTKEFKAFFESLPSDRRREVKTAMEAALQLEAMKHLHATGKMSGAECLDALCKLEDQIGKPKKTKDEKKAARKKRKKKAGLFFKKLGKGVAFITLAPVRGAFAALVALNLNGLASNMRLLKEDKNPDGWNKIKKFWSGVGGLQKALDKAIQLGTKHKALWMGKKAHAKFLEREKLEGKSSTGTKDTRWLKGTDGMYHYLGDGGVSGYDIGDPGSRSYKDLASYLSGIGLLPAAIPPMIAMGSALLAAVIPILQHSLSAQGHHAAAAGMEGAAQDLIDDHNAGKLNVTEDMIDPDGSSKDIDPDNEDANEDEQGEDDGSQEEIGSIGDVPYAGPAGPPPPSTGGSELMQQLAGPLDSLFQVGLTAAGTAINKAEDKHPKFKAILDKGETFADDHFAGYHLKKHGVKGWHKSKTIFTPKNLAIGFGAAAVLYVVTQKK